MAGAKRKAEEKQGAPTWIVSFSDMVTLLLAFFVLLQSFAHVQDPELFFVGQGSFKQAIAGLGIPKWLFGRQDRTRRKFIKVKHPMEEGPPDPVKLRMIDADNEKIRKLFADVQREIETTAADLSRQALRVEATPITFAAPGAALDEKAKAYLKQLAFDLGQSVQMPSVRVYVIGLAADLPAGERQWYESARRAGAVERYLAGLLSARAAGKGPGVYSWGAGPGGAWCRSHGFMPDRTSIVVAVIRESVTDG